MSSILLHCLHSGRLSLGDLEGLSSGISSSLDSVSLSLESGIVTFQGVLNCYLVLKSYRYDFSIFSCILKRLF